ncbi:MAG: chemotaxis protein CheW [Chloroflexi bacterium]|nr:chemotaxis protein CheW [Chloroflexota bacterium]
MEHQLVVFELANEHYGVDIAMVEGIIKMQQITAVPHAPSYVEGVTNLRGAVLPVIDLRKRFNLPPEDTTKNSRIIHIAIDNVKVGMIVDAVSEVLRVPEEAIEPTPPIVTTVDSAFITGIAKIDNRLVILLDLGKVLSINEQEKLMALSAVPA